MSTDKCQRTGGGEPGLLRRALAFTLIELLAVIGVIALLAALIVPLTGLAVAKMKLAKARAELVNVTMVIQEYKEAKGYYPPDNTNDFSRSSLFYELNGSLVEPDPANSAGLEFRPLYRTNIILKDTDIGPEFGLPASKGAFVNSTPNQAEIPVFSHTFLRTQYVEDTNAGPVKFLILACPVLGTSGAINPWNYNSSNPTNNPNSYDLWVDILIRDKTNRICNWSSTPIIL